MVKRNLSTQPPLVYEIKDEYTEVHYDNEFGIDGKAQILESEWIILKYFEEKIPIELLMVYANLRADSIGLERGECYFHWYPIESICERLISGETDDSFKNVYYNQLLKLKKQIKKKDKILFANDYKDIFMTPEPFASDKYISIPYFDPRLDEIINIIENSSVNFNMESLMGDLLSFIGPWKKGFFSKLTSDELEISEFAHLIRIAKDCEKITKDNNRVKLIRSLALERAISFFNAIENPEFKKKNEDIITRLTSIQNEIIPVKKMKKDVEKRKAKYENDFEDRFEKIVKYYKQWAGKDYIDEPGVNLSALSSRVITMYFKEHIPIEDIIVTIEDELKKIKKSRRGDFTVWAPIYALIQHRIAGEKPEKLIKIFSDASDIKSYFIGGFPRKSLLSVCHEFSPALNEVTPNSDLNSIISVILPVLEDNDYGTEMTLCFQLAKDVGKIYKNEQQQNLLAGLLLERALSFPAHDIAYSIDNPNFGDMEIPFNEGQIIEATELMNLIENVRLFTLSTK